MIERFEAISIILGHVGERDLVLSTTGMISREVFMAQDRPENFYMLGSMGLVSALGLGLALLVPDRCVVVLEGDGSALMSLGTLALISAESPANLIHIVLDNEVYESTGGQPTISHLVDLAAVGRSCGYVLVIYVASVPDLIAALMSCQRSSGPQLLLVKTSVSPIRAIPRVSHTPIEIRDRFIQCIQSREITE